MNIIRNHKIGPILAYLLMHAYGSQVIKSGVIWWLASTSENNLMQIPINIQIQWILSVATWWVGNMNRAFSCGGKTYLK